MPRSAGDARQLLQLTRDLARCCQSKEEQIFRRFDLSCAEGRVLLTMAETGASNPTEVARQLGIGRSRLTPLVDRLVQKGFIARTESSADRRVRHLALHPSGARIADEVFEYQLNFHRTLLRRFSAEERDGLFGTLVRLHEEMSALSKQIAGDDSSLGA